MGIIINEFLWYCNVYLMSLYCLNFFLITYNCKPASENSGLLAVRAHMIYMDVQKRHSYVPPCLFNLNYTFSLTFSKTTLL